MDLLTTEPWVLREIGFHPEQHRLLESLFSLGNGYMGHRGSFEEHYSGDARRSGFLAGVHTYGPTPRSVWKTGYPDQQAYLAQAPTWIGLDIELDGESLDLALCQVLQFERTLDFQHGILSRICTVELPSGRQVQLSTQRFCSLVTPQVGAVQVRLTPLNFSGTINVSTTLNANISPLETTWGSAPWAEISNKIRRTQAYLTLETKSSTRTLAAGMKFSIWQGGQPLEYNSFRIQREREAGLSVDLRCQRGQELVFEKMAAFAHSDAEPVDLLLQQVQELLKAVTRKGYSGLLQEHQKAWENRWERLDVIIQGDEVAQQAIRFNIFHLYQTFTGTENGLNLGLRGFSGDAYGGLVYWYSDAYGIPFYYFTAGPAAARRMLSYRFRHFPAALANAKAMGIGDRAALFPMATLDGGEALHEWEVSQAAIHRNGALAWAIAAYVQAIPDTTYLVEEGLPLLVAIARFWAGRVHRGTRSGRYVLHGVTGPNEYESNVNNNWYTNFLAAWNLRHTHELLAGLRKNHPALGATVTANLDLNESEEAHWLEIATDLQLPADEMAGVFPQQDDYFEKELLTVADLPESERPITAKWTWDRVLRSGFVEQADVLQAFYFFPEAFDQETLRLNYAFYEPRTVHETPFSHSVHAVLAARLGLPQEAYAHFLSGVRFDLDNQQNTSQEGLHLPGMALAWLALVKGIAGVQSTADHLVISPCFPAHWKFMQFRIHYQQAYLEILLNAGECTIRNLTGFSVRLLVFGQERTLGWREEVTVSAFKHEE